MSEKHIYSLLDLFLHMFYYLKALSINFGPMRENKRENNSLNHPINTLKSISSLMFFVNIVRYCVRFKVRLYFNFEYIREPIFL